MPVRCEAPVVPRGHFRFTVTRGQLTIVAPFKDIRRQVHVSVGRSQLPPYGMFLPSRPQAQRRIADWQELIIWSEIFRGTTVTRADFVDQVKRVGVNRGLRLVTAINTIALRHGETSAGVQAALAADLTKGLPLVRQPISDEIRKGRVLFSSEQITILAGYIIQYGASNEPDPEHVMDAFINAVLMVNELFGEEQLQVREAAGNDLESFLPIELRAAALEHEPMDHLIARIHAFVIWARAQDQSSKRYLDVDSAFLSIFGQSYEDVTAAGITVWNYFRNINSVAALKILDPILDVEFLVLPLTVQAPIREFVRAHSIPIAELAGLLADRNRMTAAALLPLQKRPLIELGNGLYASPNLTFLSATLGIGLFHRLAEYFEVQGKRLKFYDFFARFLQHYTEQMIALSLDKRPAQVLPEFEYKLGKKRKDSSDVIVIEGRTAIFFDVCNKRLSTELSLNAADLKSMHADIDGMILHQAKQLDGRIVDFRAGAYTIGGLTSADIDTIIPVAVTHQSIHGWAATRRYVDRRLRELNYLQTGPRLEIISIAEIETLVQAFDGDVSYGELLSARAGHPQEIARGRSLKNYLLLNAGWNGKGKQGMPGYGEWFDSVAAAKLTAWGLPKHGQTPG